MQELNGILCIDKPEGFTSFDVVAKMRGILKTRKIGHAGTLDPMATGVLPLFLGRATKACDILPSQDKRYLAQFQLGITTDTLDVTGETTGTFPVAVTEQQVREASLSFCGDIMQIPPMYSAIRVDGKRLYELARSGQTVERKPRPVTIYSLEFLSYNPQTHLCEMDVHCSKGTYIRTLVDDIGRMLGCGAALSGLRRTMAAGFTIEQCRTIEQVQADQAVDKLAVLPVEQAFDSQPKVVLSAKQAQMFLNGIRLDAAKLSCPSVKEPMSVYTHTGQFLGIAKLLNGKLHMQKLFTLREDLAL